MPSRFQRPLSISLLVLVFLPIAMLNAYEPLITIGKPTLIDILYSPNRRFLATLTSSYLELLDAETYAPVTQVDLAASRSGSILAFSPDSSLLAISGVEEGIQIWHVDSETFVANIPDEHEEDILAFSPDGKYLAYANGDSVFLWDVERKENAIELTGDPQPAGSHRVQGIAFHPNSKVLAVGSFRNSIALWDIETGEISSYLELGFEDSQNGAISFSQDGTRLAAIARYGTGSGRTVRLWDVATGDTKYRLNDLQFDPRDLAFTPDDQHLLVGSGDGNLYIIETETFSEEKIPAVDHLPRPGWSIISLGDLTFHPDGKRIAGGINDSRIRIWDTQDFTRLHTIYGYGYAHSQADAVYLPGLNRIVTGRYTDVLHFWDATTGELLKAFEFYWYIEHIEAASDGRNIVIDVEITHQIWDAANAEPMQVFEARGPANTKEIELSPSGKYLVSTGWGGTFMWDTDTGARLTWLDENGGERTAIFSGCSDCGLLEFTPDEEQIITILSDQDDQLSTAFWDIETGRLMNEIEHIGPLVDIGIDFLHARQVEDTIEIRLLQSDRLLSRISDQTRSLEPRDFIRQRQFHPSGSVLAVRYEGDDGEPGEYRFYDTQTGELIAAIPGIRDFQFAADGSYMFLVDDRRQLALYRTSEVIGEPVPLITAVGHSGKQITALGRIKQDRLMQNYPNPSNPETWIPYQLASDSHVIISIYDVSGNLVRTLDMGQRESGLYVDREKAAGWDGNNQQGEPVGSGVYFYQLAANDSYSSTRKMLISR
ncbi:FlgD immunoglobulin-like domain containing protein [Candidatus Poribacteria bacterium]